MRKIDPFGALSTFEKSDGTNANYMSLKSLEDSGVCNLDDIPFSIRILLESALRKCDGFLVNEADVRRIAQWSPEMTPAEIPFSPSSCLLYTSPSPRD